MIKKWLVATTLVLAVSPVFAWQTMGAGASTCGTWIKARQAGHWYDMTSWVLGYHAAAQDQAALELREVDLNAVEAYVDKYCSDRPLNSLLDASRALVVELK